MTKRALALAFLLTGSPACKQHTPKKASNAVAAKQPGGAEREIRHHGQGAEEAGLSGPADEDDSEGGGANGANGGGGGARYKNPVIYVDGEVRASFSYNEMPSTVKVLERRYGDDGEDLTHRMLVCDYFHALGVDCSQIKETQWYAGKGRVAVISGSELRRFHNSLYFNFTKDLSGKPRVEWQSATALHTTNKPDLVADVCIYVKKKAPKWDIALWALVDDHGNPYDGIPYNHDEGKRGVRVNVDGRMVGKIKRNLLEGNVEPVREPKPGEEARYRIVDFLKATGVDVAQVRGVNLLVRDERVVRLTKEEVQSGLEFTAAKQHHGEMMFYFGKHYVPALAVDVWANTDAPVRPMRTVTLGNPTADRGPDSLSTRVEVHARR